MYRNARSYSLIRTLILAAASLAIVGVLFAIYQSVTGDPVTRRTSSSLDLDEGDSPSGENSAAEGGVTIRDGVKVGAGERGSVVIYGSEGDRALVEFSWRTAQPIAGDSPQYSMGEPEIRMRTPDGQLVEVTAAEGLIHLKSADQERFEPVRGMLMGDVLIRVDRLNTRQRAALPEEERNNPGPDRLITVELDDLHFDLETARLETAGHFKVTAAEAVIESDGLALRYNERDSSIEHLKIEQQGRIVVRGMGEMFRIGLQADQPAGLASSQEPADEVVPAEPEATPAVAEQPAPESQLDIPILPLEEKKSGRVHPTIQYHAVFTEQVQVRQLDGGVVSAELLADTLELLFGFGQKERDAARSRASVPSEQTAAAGAPDDAVEASTEPAEQIELSVTWTGSLEINTVDQPEGSAPPAEEGAVVTAIGTPVHLLQADRGSVQCAKLVFEEQRQRARLYGQAGVPVVINSGDGGRIEGVEMVLDMQAGEAHITGPGRMSDTADVAGLGVGDATAAGPRRSDIRFQSGVDVVFAVADVVKVDPLTGRSVEKKRQYLERATFFGRVVMRQGGDSISGERVEIKLGPPRKEGTFADNIESLTAEGGVSLRHGAELVRCERIEIELGLDQAGRIAPRQAWAYTNVSATQGDRSITADEKMIVELGSFLVPREPWDPGKARAEAVRRNVDPDTVDWEKQRAKYESRERYTPGLQRVQAVGNVKVRDPGRRLKVDAVTLDCTFAEGQEINRARVVGSETARAYVEIDDFSITGREVYLDVPGESAEVPAAGRMTFVSDRDLDGREVDEPIPVAITWSESMRYRGLRNRATFTGKVRAATAESIFDCGELVVDFAEASPEQGDSGTGPGAPDRFGRDWWVFTPVYAWVVSGDGQADPMLGREFNKEPIYLLATGGAVAETTRVEQETGRVLSRGHIEGPRLLVDLRSEILTVEGAGNLLIEDYELPTGSGQKLADRRTPFGGLGVGSPSQTFITWSRQMSYYFGNQAAIFEKGVEMVHRSGAAILKGREVLGPAAAMSAEGKADQGRSASLSCGQLLVQFRDRKQPGRDRLRREGAGSMSGFDLSQFEAKQAVHFQSDDRVLLAEQVTFDAGRNILTIWGLDENNPAEMYHRHGKFNPIKGPFFRWNRTTGEIDFPGAVIGQ